MISNNCFIIEADKRYLNTIEFLDGELIVNSDYDSVKHLNREGVLVGLPHDYEGNLKKGMRVVFHHNILRISKDTQGKIVSNYHVKDNLFRVPLDLLYLYREGDEWKAYGEYCFVVPVEAEQKEMIGSIFIPETAREKYDSLVGVMEIPNENLGIAKGTKIVFKKNSEHKYELDGKLMYKMKTNRVMWEYNDLIAKVASYNGN